jgi:hypothetical protein
MSRGRKSPEPKAEAAGKKTAKKKKKKGKK